MDQRENIIFKKINTKIDENEILKKLSEEYEYVNDLLAYNEFNVGERLEKNAFYQEKFRMLYIAEMQKLTRIQTNFDKKAGELYDYYKYKDSKDLSKTEIERYYLPSNPELIKLKKLIELQKTRVEFFSAITEAFKSCGFNMKSYIQNIQVGS